MATLTETFVAPEWLDPDVQVAASYTNGRRCITWTFHRDDNRKLLGNQAAWAHVTVREEEALRGDKLFAYAERRIDYNGQRDNFTERASKKLRGDIVTAVARYGFERMWTELHNRNADDRATHARDMAEYARRAAAWWEAQADLVDLDALGLLVVDPIERNYNVRQPTQTIANRHSPYGTDHTPVIARLLHDGEHVGWVTDSYELVPDEAILGKRP